MAEKKCSRYPPVALDQLVERLRSRVHEIEVTIETRVMAIDPPTRSSDLEYLEGLRRTIPAAIDHALSVIEVSERHAPPPPACLIEQARLAARHSIKFESVQRRYMAGRDLLANFLLEEFEREPQAAFRLRDLMAVMATALDKLLETLATEYSFERSRALRTPSEQKLNLVRQLLNGQPADTSDVDYDLDAVHVGLIADGPDSGNAIRGLARALDGRLLLVNPAPGRFWAWIGRQHSFERERAQEQISAEWPRNLVLSIGEPGIRTTGWRQTHQQAQKAFWVALRRNEKIASYARDGLLASVAADDLAVRSLRDHYLRPLSVGSDGGASLRQTLRLYFESGWNGASTAAALGISRQAVKERLRRIEAHVGCCISACAGELDLALRLDELEELR